VIRGGIGLFGYTWSDDTYGPGLGNAFGSNGGIKDNTNGTNPVVLLASDGNTNYQGPGGLSVNQAYLTAPTAPDAYNGQGISYQQYHTPVPKILQWNFEVQQEVGANMVLKAAYVASHGYNLLFPVDINQVPEAQLGPNDAGSRPYPLFQSIGSGNTGSGGTNNGVSNYHSLQTTVSQRLSRGLEFNANYVWSHMLDSIDSSGWGGSAGNAFYQNSYDVGANYGASNYDIRNSFKASALYDLPVGRGRQFLNNNRLVDEAIGGWQVAPTIIWSSGIPYTIIMSGDNSFSQSNSSKQYPLQVGNPNPAHKSINEWFNPASFMQPTAGTFGNTQRNNLYGPQYLLINAAVGKTFHIWENVNFEIRASAKNVINHPSFDAPGNQSSSGNVIDGGTDGVINKVTVGGRTMQIYGRISF
jgi:hypothetical protein